MIFEHSFIVAAPIKLVVDFHRSSSNLKAITPPIFSMSRILAPDHLSEGNEMAFTLWMGPFPIRWEVRVENFSPAGFDDIQVSGPFDSWAHTHRFEALDENCTRVLDHIEYNFRPHLFWGGIGILMAIGLPSLFRYRARRTKAINERNRSKSIIRDQ